MTANPEFWDDPNNIADWDLLPPARVSTYHVTDDPTIGPTPKIFLARNGELLDTDAGKLAP